MPALFDMPVEQLRTYQGRNPRPADFDAFWDRGIAEMRGVDPCVELRPSSFSTPVAECLDLYYTGVGGARIHAKFLRPRDVLDPHPAVVMFHGYGSHSFDWFSKLPYVALGYSVAVMDCRGQGFSQDLGCETTDTFLGHVGRGMDGPPENMLFRKIFLDAAQLAGILMSMPDVDPARVAATGGSQGGGLTLACAALEPRVRLAAPVYPFLSDYRRMWEMDLATKEGYGDIFNYFRKHDPLHQREDEIFERFGYIDIQHLCPRIKAEVLMQTGLMDQICPPSTQFAAYNKITSPKNVLLYPEWYHENLYEHQDRIFEFLSRMAG